MVGPFVQLTCGGPVASGCVGCPPTTQGDPESTGREEGILSGTVGYLGHAGWARALMDCACVAGGGSRLIRPQSRCLPCTTSLRSSSTEAGGLSQALHRLVEARLVRNVAVASPLPSRRQRLRKLPRLHGGPGRAKQD